MTNTTPRGGSLEPLHLYDCCPENDGAAAIVITTAERARDLPREQVAILAGAHGLEHRDGVAAFGEANFPTAHHRHVGRQLWQRAGVKPEHIPVAQFYENFTGPVLMAISEMGFCEPGRDQRLRRGRQPAMARRAAADQHERRQPR